TTTVVPRAPDDGDTLVIVGASALAAKAAPPRTNASTPTSASMLHCTLRLLNAIPPYGCSWDRNSRCAADLTHAQQSHNPAAKRRPPPGSTRRDELRHVHVPGDGNTSVTFVGPGRDPKGRPRPEKPRRQRVSRRCPSRTSTGTRSWEREWNESEPGLENFPNWQLGSSTLTVDAASAASSGDGCTPLRLHSLRARALPSAVAGRPRDRQVTVYSGPEPPSGGVSRPPFAVMAPHCTQFDGAIFTSTRPSSPGSVS